MTFLVYSKIDLDARRKPEKRQLMVSAHAESDQLLAMSRHLESVFIPTYQKKIMLIRCKSIPLFVISSIYSREISEILITSQ